MTDSSEVDLQAPELLEEIRLLGDLMVAAAESTERLGQTIADAILRRAPAA